MIIIIILLILCLPLILMLTLYSATTAISMAVAVPVSGIDVLVEDLVELDLDKGDSYTVEYIISPTEAKNKKVKYIFEQIGEEKLATFTVDGDTITPTSAGQAKVIVETVDGAYRDSFNVIVYSRRVSAIESRVVDSVIGVGKTTKIETTFYPITASNKGLAYRVVEGEDVVTVSKTGEIRGIGIGTARIEVSSTNNPDAKSYVDIRVQPSGVMDFANNKQSLTVLQSPHGEFVLVLNPSVTFVGEPVIEIFDSEGNPLPSSVMTASYDKVLGRLSYDIHDRTVLDTFEIKVTVTPDGQPPVSKSCYITQVSQITAEWAEREEWINEIEKWCVIQSNGENIVIDLDPLGADVTFTAILEYVETTNIEGSVHSGERFTLMPGTVYIANGGYFSVEIVNSADGAHLRVERTREPNTSDFADAEASIKLFIKDNNDPDSDEIALEEIFVMIW